MQTCSTRCSASSYRATGVCYYGCRPAATRCRAFRRRLQEHGCAAGVAQPNVVAAGIDLGRAADGARLVAAVAFIVAALACEVVVTAPAAARVAVEATHLEKRSGQRNRRRSAAAWCRLPRRYSFGGGATLVDAMLAHDGSAGPPGDAPSVDRRFRSDSDWGDNKSTFLGLLFRKVLSEVATTRQPSLTFRSIATVGPSAHGLSGARMAERSLEAIAYS